MQLPYFADPLPLLAALRPLGRAVLLQSADPGHPENRLDILTAAPLKAIETRGEVSLTIGGGRTAESTRDPFALLEDLLAELPTLAPEPGIPFRGGVLGLAGYDLGRRLEPYAERLGPDLPFPDLAAGLYDWAVVTDHARRTTRVHRIPGHDLPDGVADALAHPLPVERVTPPRLAPDTDAADYARAFERVQDYIAAGDCYQINLAVRFSGSSDADPLALYRTLLEANPAPFSGFLETPAGAVLSFSPERLLRCENRAVHSSPIKGTRPRRTDARADAEERAALLASEKDRAENLMIVDLLRNDLGRSCEPGSIHVPALFEAQSFAGVHHLVSTVAGRLRGDVSPLRALAHAFPGGSITGAPKIRAMEIIEELEDRRRGPYCGSLFRAGPDGTLDASITIRTLLQSDGRVHCWGGGGLVADSAVDAEWDEIHHKVGRLVGAQE
jgi:para-aminobenzoate synthetase component 1